MNNDMPSWKPAYPPSASTFESMLFPLPSWDMLVPWRVPYVHGSRPTNKFVGFPPNYFVICCIFVSNQ